MNTTTDSKPVPRQGSGRLQWNAEGWFGSLLGGTLWMLLAAGADFARWREVPWVLCAAFAFAVGLGVWLWKRRDRITPYAGIQILLAGLTVSATAALLYLRSSWGPEGQSLLYLGIFPAMMVFFHYLESRARKASD